MSPLPGRGCPQCAHWGREWNAGDNLHCGTGKDLLKLYVLKSLFLRTESNVSARIPLPTRFSSLRSGGPPSPREKGCGCAAKR